MDKFIAAIVLMPVLFSSCMAEDKNPLKKKLTPMQYKVTQEGDTEMPFKNEYWNNKKEGIYVDVVSGEPLFSSLDKFDSGTGWPSFTTPIEDKRITYHKDTKLFQERTEVKSSVGSHLGHVFDDGPGKDGKRYCINSASMRFVPKEKLVEEGYARYLPSFDKDKNTAYAYLAGGCFWGMERYLGKLKGVKATNVGYIGGDKDVANYNEVKTGLTGHAEAVEVIYDPSILSYRELIKYFFRIHDPTTLNRQKNDIGTQYRSAIFTNNESEIQTVKDIIKKIDSSKYFSDPVTTKIEPISIFGNAEEYHQDYLKKNPNGYDCHLLNPKELPFE